MRRIWNYPGRHTHPIRLMVWNRTEEDTRGKRDEAEGWETWGDFLLGLSDEVVPAQLCCVWSCWKQQLFSLNLCSQRCEVTQASASHIHQHYTRNSQQDFFFFCIYETSWWNYRVFELLWQNWQMKCINQDIKKSIPHSIAQLLKTLPIKSLTSVRFFVKKSFMFTEFAFIW